MRTNVLGLAAFLGALSAATGASRAGEAIELPFQENFARLPAAPWLEKRSSGGKITVKDGWATFESSPKGHVHIQRPAGVDRITISAEVVRWAGIYLIWDADNWCGLGKQSPTPFGRFYSIAVKNGQAEEVDHRGIDFNWPHRIRLQLGSDHVRFQYSNDGRQWLDLRTIERPKGYAGAPKWIAAGKSYDGGDKPFPEAPPLSPPGTGGDKGGGHSSDGKVSGAVRRLRVEATPQREWELDEAQRKALREPPGEPVNALLHQSKEDPTYEQIVKHYPAMKYPREVVGVPAHPLDIGVDRLGRLDVSPWSPRPAAWLEVGDPPMPLGREDVPFTRRLRDGYLPVLTLTTERGGVRYTLTVFGWSEAFRVDKDLFAYVRLSARSTGAGRLPRRLALVWGDNQRRGWEPAAIPGKGAEWFLRFRYPKPESAEIVPAAEFQAKEEETVSHWKKRLEPAARFEVPDRRVMEAYRAWIVYSLLNTDTINGYLEPRDGSGFYEEMFGGSVAMHTVALDQYGLPDHAAKVLDTQIHFQQPDGLYTQACGLTDAGAFLMGLARHYRMNGDRTWLQRVSPNIIKQCAWLARKRKAAPKEGTLRGIIKFRPYNDYPDPVYNYMSNTWCAQGMHVAAQALQEIDLPEGDIYAAEAAKYRQDILDSMEAAAVTDRGQALLPMEPDTHRMLKLSKYRAGSYYGLVASSLLEADFLPPRDKRAVWIVDALEKRGGLIAGLCEFQGGIDHAYTYGYLMNALQRDEVRKVLLGFWSMMAFGMTRDTYSPVEVTQIATGENHFTLPHLYSCTEQLRLLRNLLLREEDGVLWIGQGVPRAWLAPGKHITATKAPSEFGEVSFKIKAENDGTMHVHLDPPKRRIPAEVRLRLRHPERRSIAAVKSTPQVESTFSGETIRLRNLKTPVELVVHFK